MNILWHGVRPQAKSGYGVASRNILPRLKALGHDVACMSVYSLPGVEAIEEGIPVWPVRERPFGADVLYEYVQRHQADIVITLFDQWPMKNVAAMGPYWVPYVVLHYEPMEEVLYKAVKDAPFQLALSEWAAKVMRAEGLDPIVIPLGVDTKFFRPIHGEMHDGVLVTQQRCRAFYKLPPDSFVVGMVAANRDHRKNLEGQLRVFADFAKAHPEAQLLFHTNPTPSEGGWDLYTLIRKLGIARQVTMTLPGQADLPDQELRVLYNCLDVFLGCAMSEGAGLPPLEANACGIPAIVTDFSSMPEYSVGWHLPGTRKMTPMYSYGMAVDEQALYDTLLEARSLTPESKAEMAQEARRHALTMDWDVIVRDCWVPFLDRYQLERVL